MLTKQVSFDDDVLQIIRTMQWRDEGKLGILTCDRLERKLYEKVNKALEIMGGKWNKKLGGHIFKIDPRSQVKGLVENGKLKVERDGFFETPKTIVKRMLGLVEPIGMVLEPSAGLGAIVDNLPVHKDFILCFEKNEQRAGVLRSKGYTVRCCDFLEYKNPNTIDTVFMNPPFEELQDVDHVIHDYDCLQPGGRLVSVTSESPFFREDKKAKMFREWFESVGSYSEKLPDKSFNESGTGVNARLVVITKN